jgi:hypothetical protein
MKKETKPPTNQPIPPVSNMIVLFFIFIQPNPTQPNYIINTLSQNT